MLFEDSHIFPFHDCPNWVNRWLTHQPWLGPFGEKMRPFTKGETGSEVWPHAVRLAEECAGYQVFFVHKYDNDTEALFIRVPNSPEVTMLILKQK